MRFDKSGKLIKAYHDRIENNTQLEKCLIRITNLRENDNRSEEEQDELLCLVPMATAYLNVLKAPNSEAYRFNKPKTFHTGEGLVEVPLPPHLADLFPKQQVEQCPCVHKTNGRCIRVNGHEDDCIFVVTYGACEEETHS